MLSMLMMLCGSVFAADDVTIKASSLSGIADNTPITVSGYTFTALKNDGTTAPTYNSNNDDVRLYAKNTLTIKAGSGSITKITFNLSTQGKKRLTEITANVGTIAKQAVADETVVWTGNATEVTFTVGEKAIYGSDGEGKAGQFDFSEVVFGAGGTSPDPDPDPTTVRSYKKVTAVESGKAYLIVANNSGLKAAQPVPAGKTFSYLAVTDVTDKDGVVTMKDATQDFIITSSGSNFTIKQPDGRLFRNDENYKTISVDETIDTPDWTITANGDGTFKIQNATTGKWIQLDPQYGTYGCYDEEKGNMPYLYAYDGEVTPDPDPDPEVQTVADIAAFKALASGTEAKLMLNNAEVLYAGTNDIYVRDASGAIDFYKSGLSLTSGNVLNGSVIGKYTLYNTTPEFTSTNNTNSSDIQQKAGDVQPKAISPADAAKYICDLVKISGATIVERVEGKYTNTYAVVGSQEVQLYDKFNVVKGEVEEGKAYDIVGIIVPFKESVEICPISDYTNGEVQPDEIKDATVAEFNAAEESTTVWYRLKGEVKNLKDGDKYGNFDLEDATGSVYVYGLLSEKGGEKGQFQTLAAEKGIKNGCKITLIGNRGSFGDKIEVTNAYFVSLDEAAPAELVISGEVNFDESTTVTITPSDVDHDVYYTLDGSDPSDMDKAKRYMEPFTITETCTVRAWEEDANLFAEKTFTKNAEAEEITVEDVIAAAPENTNAADGQAKVWVKGYIVGFIEGQAFATGAKFTNEGCETKTNLILATYPDETNVENCIPVQLPTGNVRDDLNLQDHPDNYGKEVMLYGYVLKYFSVPGFKNVTDYKFTGNTSVELINAETMKDGKMYNIAGQRVNSSFKGIVIMNGKKFMVK